MLTAILCTALGAGLTFLWMRTTSGSPSADPAVLADLRKLVDKERAAAKPDPLIYRYCWYDMPENLELVNKLLARGYFRNAAGQFTNSRKTVWLECTEHMGWTAYCQDGQGRRKSCWLPAKFPQHFDLLVEV